MMYSFKIEFVNGSSCFGLALCTNPVLLLKKGIILFFHGVTSPLHSSYIREISRAAYK